MLEDTVTAMSEPLGRATVALIASAASGGLAVAPDGPSSQAKRRAVTRVVVERAKERGELPASVDADLLLDLLAAPVWMTLIIWGRPLSTLDVPTLVDSVLDGVLPR